MYFDFNNFSSRINVLSPLFRGSSAHFFHFVIVWPTFCELEICFSGGSYNNSSRGVFILKFDYFFAVARTEIFDKDFVVQLK